METNIYGELDNGLTFWLNPDWVKGWEQDEEDSFKEKDESKDKSTR